MAFPTISEPAEQLYSWCDPAFTVHDTEANDYPLAKLCHALTLGVVPFWLIAQTNWAAIFDLEQVPDEALDYLGQFVGSQFLPETTPAQKRELIANPTGFERGTVEALYKATRVFLTGSKSVILIERAGGDAYHLYIRSILSETPDEALVRNAILNVKPAGLVLDYDAVTGPDYLQIDTAYATYADLDAAYAMYSEMEEPL